MKRLVYLLRKSEKQNNLHKLILLKNYTLVQKRLL